MKGKLTKVAEADHKRKLNKAIMEGKRGKHF